MAPAGRTARSSERPQNRPARGLLSRSAFDQAFLAPGITQPTAFAHGQSAIRYITSNHFASDGSRNATSDILIDGITTAEQTVQQALALNPDDAGIRRPAGKILLDAKKPAPALEHLTTAARLEPDSVKVRYLLLKACRDLGDQQRSAEQQQILERISRSGPEPERASPMERVLFAVHP